MLDAQMKAMVEAARQMGAPPLSSFPLELARTVYQKACNDKHIPYAGASRDLTVDGAVGPLAARLYTPKGAPAAGPGMVFFHGGGFVIGDLESHDGMCRQLTDGSGVRILAIDYRRAPETPFPGPHQDALAAAHWAFEHAEQIGFDPARIALGGDSAGGNLAASTAIALRNEGRYRPAFQLLLYPVVDFAGPDTESMRQLSEGYFLTRDTMNWFSRNMFGDTDPSDPRASVLQTPSMEGLPPALVVTAGFDPLKDSGRAYADRLRASGVKAEHREFEGFLHGFYNMAGVSPAVIPAILATAQALKAGLA